MEKREMFELLNKQMNFEDYSAHIYLDMAAYCHAKGYKGLASWFHINYDEEMFHMQKFFAYLLDVDFRPTILKWDVDPTGEYGSLLELAKVGLAHEKEVTERILHLYETAKALNDYATMKFLEFFISEQVEEEAKFKELIDKLEMIQDNTVGLYMIDKEYAAIPNNVPANPNVTPAA